MVEENPVFLIACSDEKSLISRQRANPKLLTGAQLLSANAK